MTRKTAKQNRRAPAGKSKRQCASASRADKTRQQKRWFYLPNDELLLHPVNKTFEEVLWMSKSDFRKWVDDYCTIVTELWDEQGIPPLAGCYEEQILDQFDKIESFPVHEFLVKDIKTNKRNVIRNTSLSIGSAVNQWFPTMMKTVINNSEDTSKGRSIYDYHNDPRLFDKLVQNAEKVFRRDSRYFYSAVVPKLAPKTKLNVFLFSCRTGREWIALFEKVRSSIGKTYDYWLNCLKEEDYSGNSESLKAQTFLTVTRKELRKLNIPKQCWVNVSRSDEDSTVYRIRVFEKGQRLFPVGLDALPQSFQNVSNFPPLTAKFIYERYLKKLALQRKAIIWDPSAGWGGRILGAMGIGREFSVHYIGTDPNKDHVTTTGRTKYHEIADFYNRLRTGEVAGRAKLPFATPKANTYQIFSCGSEDVRYEQAFRAFKGKVDIVFTSPPYFAKELYSKHKGQSARKFKGYESWRDGFLKPTLATAVEWLRPGGYLLWNIADAKFDGELLPLEFDSCNALEDLGMKKVEVLKMALAPSPGANRKTDKGAHTAKNSCEVMGTSGKLSLKFEPIYCFQKPGASSPRKRSSNSQLAYEEAAAYAEEITHLAIEFENAISGNQVNAARARAIYCELENKLRGTRGETIHGAYQTYAKNDFDLVEFTPKGTKKPRYVFVRTSIARRSSKSLADKYVLIQLFDNAPSARQPIFAWARAEVPELDDDPKCIYVDVCGDQRFAESSHGYSLKVAKTDILRVESHPVVIRSANDNE